MVNSGINKLPLRIAVYGLIALFTIIFVYPFVMTVAQFSQSALFPVDPSADWHSNGNNYSIGRDHDRVSCLSEKLAHYLRHLCAFDDNVQRTGRVCVRKTSRAGEETALS